MALRLPNRFRIRVRTAAALSVPVAMLFVAAGLQVAESGREAAEVRRQGELATASIGPAGAINALMAERNYTSLWLFGVENTIELHVDSVEDARARTDAALDAFRSEVRQRGGRAERIYGPAIAELERIDENRERVDAYEGERNPAIANPSGDRVWSIYNRVVTALADANSRLAHEVEDTQLRQGVQLVDRATRQIDRISKLVRRSTIEAVLVGGHPITDRQEFGRLARMMTEADRSHLAILDATTGPYAALREPLREESEATGIFGIEDRFAETGVVQIAELLGAVSLDEDESYLGFVHDVSGIVQERADHLASAALAAQRRTVALSVLVLLVAVGAALAVARSITGPLRSLTRQARDMAERRLPEAVREVHETPLGVDVVVPELEPVAVASRDEVADLADQLNAAQEAALDLAVEQAVLRRNFSDVFVNLCRRIQALLGRQLDVIAEVTEGRAGSAPVGGAGRAVPRRRTPDLGEVSRYAVRLRRHAESLLVLAGVEPRPAPTRPAPLDAVVRAALDEVWGAERVRVGPVEPVLVAGSVVSDLAHLLAELVEGAVRELFPEETVDVAGGPGGGAGSGYAVYIVDPGSSLAEDEIDRANRRLAGEEPGTTAPSRHLGQYVAARLAARHGISVELSGTMAAGVTATVVLPPTVLGPAVAPALTPAPALAPAAGPAESPSQASELAPALDPPLDPAAGPGEEPALVPPPDPASDTEPGDDGPDEEPALVAPGAGGEPHPSGPNPVVGVAAGGNGTDGNGNGNGNGRSKANGNGANGTSGSGTSNGSGDDEDVDVYSMLSDFTEGVERAALAVPGARRRPGPAAGEPRDGG